MKLFKNVTLTIDSKNLVSFDAYTRIVAILAKFP